MAICNTLWGDGFPRLLRRLGMTRQNPVHSSCHSERRAQARSRRIRPPSPNHRTPIRTVGANAHIGPPCRTPSAPVGEGLDPPAGDRRSPLHPPSIELVGADAHIGPQIQTVGNADTSSKHRPQSSIFRKRKIPTAPGFSSPHKGPSPLRGPQCPLCILHFALRSPP